MGRNGRRRRPMVLFVLLVADCAVFLVVAMVVAVMVTGRDDDSRVVLVLLVGLWWMLPTQSLFDIVLERPAVLVAAAAMDFIAKRQGQGQGLRTVGCLDVCLCHCSGPLLAYE